MPLFWIVIRSGCCTKQARELSHYLDSAGARKVEGMAHVWLTDGSSGGSAGGAAVLSHRYELLMPGRQCQWLYRGEFLTSDRPVWM